MRYNSLSSKRGSAPLLHNALKCVLATLMLVSASGCGSTDYEIFARIEGTVTDYQTGIPLENVSITLSPSGISTQTDTDGFYQFSDLDVQQYTLTVQKSGYQPNRKTVAAVSGETLRVNIQLMSIPL